MGAVIRNGQNKISLYLGNTKIGDLSDSSRNLDNDGELKVTLTYAIGLGNNTKDLYSKVNSVKEPSQTFKSLDGTKWASYDQAMAHNRKIYSGEVERGVCGKSICLYIYMFMLYVCYLLI